MTHLPSDKQDLKPVRTEFIWNRVFISYKTREHSFYVEAIADALEQAGHEVWLDRRRPIPPWQGLGLDYFIKRGLNRSDSLLFLVPTSDVPQPSILQSLRDSLDFWLVALGLSVGLSPGFWYALWYGVFYGKSILRNPFYMFVPKAQSWQAWELKVSTELGLDIIKVAMVGAEVSLDEEDEQLSWLRPEHLEEDLGKFVVPRLEANRRVPPKLKEEVQQLVRLSLISFGFVLGVGAAIAVGSLLVVLWLILHWLGVSSIIIPIGLLLVVLWIVLWLVERRLG